MEELIHVLGKILYPTEDWLRHYYLVLLAISSCVTLIITYGVGKKVGRAAKRSKAIISKDKRRATYLFVASAFGLVFFVSAFSYATYKESKQGAFSDFNYVASSILASIAATYVTVCVAKFWMEIIEEDVHSRRVAEGVKSCISEVLNVNLSITYLDKGWDNVYEKLKAADHVGVVCHFIDPDQHPVADLLAGLISPDRTDSVEIDVAWACNRRKHEKLLRERAQQQLISKTKTTPSEDEINKKVDEILTSIDTVRERFGGLNNRPNVTIREYELCEGHSVKGLPFALLLIDERQAIIVPFVNDTLERTGKLRLSRRFEKEAHVEDALDQLIASYRGCCFNPANEVYNHGAHPKLRLRDEHGNLTPKWIPVVPKEAQNGRPVNVPVS